MIFKKKEIRKNDNTLVHICDGCKKKSKLCNCMIGNVYNVYTKDIYLKKEIRKVIENGVVADLSGEEIILNVNKLIDKNSTLKKNILTGAFTVQR
ncbi:hypothetical protein HDR60_03945 [bacterium]|nr:hypothetical protein [bacterium]MDE6224253.1 hypothetical protein [Alphaproteobacteria bacterium]